MSGKTMVRALAALSGFLIVSAPAQATFISKEFQIDGQVDPGLLPPDVRGEVTTDYQFSVRITLITDSTVAPNLPTSVLDGMLFAGWTYDNAVRSVSLLFSDGTQYRYDDPGMPSHVQFGPWAPDGTGIFKLSAGNFFLQAQDCAYRSSSGSLSQDLIVGMSQMATSVHNCNRTGYSIAVNGVDVPFSIASLIDNPSPVPLPGSAGLLFGGLALLGLLRRRGPEINGCLSAG